MENIMYLYRLWQLELNRNFFISYNLKRAEYLIILFLRRSISGDIFDK